MILSSSCAGDWQRLIRLCGEIRCCGSAPSLGGSVPALAGAAGTHLQQIQQEPRSCSRPVRAVPSPRPEPRVGAGSSRVGSGSNSPSVTDCSNGSFQLSLHQQFRARLRHRRSPCRGLLPCPAAAAGPPMLLGMSACSRKALTLLSSVFAVCGLGLLGISVSTDYWLYLEEGIVQPQNQTAEIKLSLHSGLWRVCFLAGMVSQPKPSPWFVVCQCHAAGKGQEKRGF